MRQWSVTTVALAITLALTGPIPSASQPVPSSVLPHVVQPGPLTVQTSGIFSASQPLPSSFLPQLAPPAPLTVQTGQIYAVPKGTGNATVIKPDAGGILCTENIQNPHKSTHVPENVNVVGTISCTAPVSRLVLNVGLYYNHVLVAQSGPISSYGSAYVQANAAMPCVNGLYGGAAHGYAVFPPGYVPPIGQLPVVFSPNVSIIC